MKKFIRFIRNYRLFSLAIIVVLISLGLILVKQAKIAHIVIGVLSIAEVTPLLWEMVQDARAGHYGVDILAATAIITAVILGQYWAALIVVLMLTGGQALEDYAENRAQAELTSLLEHAPVTARVLRKAKAVEVMVSQIKIGDKLVIKAGEVVPVDCQIIESQANFNETSLTGEGLPQLKQVGDLILSGSIDIDGVVIAKALALAEDSQYQQIIKLMRSATNSQAPFVRLADRFSLPFTLMAYALGLAVWVISGHSIRFLEVIIVATPCPLILAAPVALVSGMARASRYGIIVKTGLSLERLAEASIIAFDKTGTLTRGDLTVKSIKPYGKYSRSEVLKLAASLEQNSNHVLAKAVVADAKVKGLKFSKVKGLEEVAGLGVKANVRGSEVLVGSKGLLTENSVKLPKTFKVSSISQTAAYVAVDGYLAGVINFTDEIRPEAKQTLEALRHLGLNRVVVVTGDNQAAAELVAKQLPVDKIYAEALPGDKLTILSKLKPKPVIFVGDGVNDAPVLTAADVGIALGVRGSTAASESADMVVMQDNISHVALGLDIAKQTFRIAKQSILIGIGLSAGLMVVFSTGKFPPVAGALSQEVIDVFVIFNALRAHAIKPLVID